MKPVFSKVVGLKWAVLLLALAAGGRARGLGADEAEGGAATVVITNVAQFRSVPREAFLGRCGVQLDGVVTLVDTNRNLLVLQDDTGAVALNTQNGAPLTGLQAWQRVSVEAARCFPQVVGFPDYPFRPSLSEVRATFEAPANSGYYYLTRMRGWLHPPVTGEYSFWIASDNSSELWLGSDDDPTKVKKIAFISRYSWVAPREWSRYPSQHSDKVLLQAGRAYYIEGFQEQTTGGDHLAVAWQGPTVSQSVIEGRYLTPWIEKNGTAPGGATHGILREYWTNFSLGGLATITGPRPFESILSVDELRVTPRGPANRPKPLAIALNQPLRVQDNYRWAEVKGKVTFSGTETGVDILEISDGEARIQARVLQNGNVALPRFQNSMVRVQGLCEGIFDQKGVLVPGRIWVARPEDITLLEVMNTNPVPMMTEQAGQLVPTNDPAMAGFYMTRGVVTFNDRVFGKDLMFVQEDAGVIFVSMKDRDIVNRFAVGRWIEVAGGLRPGKNIPVLNPLSITELGWRSMPAPMTASGQTPLPGTLDGRWTEAEGVARKLDSDGTLALMQNGVPLSVWIGQTSTEALHQYVDAKLRVRGVLSLGVGEEPVLLCPSSSFLDVEEPAPADPFAIPTRLASNLFAGNSETATPHRVKLAGNITYGDGRSFFVQDASGGVRVHPVEDVVWPVGQRVEVVGFPSLNGPMRTLTEASARPTGGALTVPPLKLAGDRISLGHAGDLVQVSANLVAQWNRDGRTVLELQEQQRAFAAELPQGRLAPPSFAPGSRLQLTGICNFEKIKGGASGSGVMEGPPVEGMVILLRSPADVVILGSAPWWKWKHTAALVAVLLTVLGASLLRIQLLRHRLGRQLAFSRQMLASQESERHRIAANLHDGLGQNLLVIKNQAHLAMQPAAEESARQQRLNEISELTSQAIEEVRQITHDLRPYQLDRLGLTQAIRAAVSRASESTSIQFASYVDDIDAIFDKEAEIHVYRVVQEAVNNVVKHSAATEAAVVVKSQRSLVSLSIRDNGRGFDAGARRSSDPHDLGYGLRGIAERVRILGGSLAVHSAPARGASLGIEIPKPAAGA